MLHGTGKSRVQSPTIREETCSVPSLVLHDTSMHWGQRDGVPGGQLNTESGRPVHPGPVTGGQTRGFTQDDGDESPRVLTIQLLLWPFRGLVVAGYLGYATAEAVTETRLLRTAYSIRTHQNGGEMLLTWGVCGLSSVMGLLSMT